MECLASRSFLCQIARTLAHSLKCGLHFVLIGRSSIGNEAGDRLAMTGNDNLLAALNPVEESSERVLCFESTDFGCRSGVALYLS
jgi:hypothetical protein